MGLLGNYFFGCHWAFNVGIAVTYTGALTNLMSCYLEQGTSYMAPPGAKCAFFNTISMYPRSGWGGMYFSSTAMFTGHVIAEQGGFSQGLSVGSNSKAQTSAYFEGSIGGPPPNNQGGAGVQIGSGGVGFGNYILSYRAPGSGAYQDLYLGATKLHFGQADDSLGTLDAAGLKLPASRAYYVNGNQVVGARITGWTAATGTASRGAFAAAAAGTASGSYTASELQGALDRIAAIEARIVAYDADLRAHGLVGT
jgi:hypothetical protein